MTNGCVSRNLRSFNYNSIKNYNSFPPLLDHVECFKWNNSEHKDHDFRINTLRLPHQRWEEDIFRDRHKRKRVWIRKKEEQVECGLALCEQNKDSQLYIDSGCSIHTS